jgi:hypothetical protein
MNTEVTNSPSAPIGDESTTKILAGAPLAPDLNKAAPSAPASAPSASLRLKTLTATANKPVLYDGKIYAKGDTITAPRADLKKFASVVTITKATAKTLKS